MIKQRTVLTWKLMALLACASGALAVCAADDSAPAYSPFGLNAEVGTTGYGGTGSWRFADHLGVGGGFDYFSYSRSGAIKDITYNVKLRLMSEPLTLNWFPWADNSFHVSLGAAFNQNRIEGTKPTGPFTINGNNYNGTLDLKITQLPVSPYLSVGGNFFYFDHARHWSMGGELGAMYTGKPHVSLTSSDATATADLASERQKVVSYANKLQFWPVIKLQIGYSF